MCLMSGCRIGVRSKQIVRVVFRVPADDVCMSVCLQGAASIELGLYDLAEELLTRALAHPEYVVWFEVFSLV